MKQKMTKKYAKLIREVLESSKFTKGYKTAKCAEIRQFFEENKKSKNLDYELYLNVCMYANLNKILFGGSNGK